MIADPMRPWWHGRQHTKIAASIVDINKVYHTLFNIYGICEALGTTAVSHPTGTFQGMYMGKYNIIDGLGIVVVNRDLVALDSMLLYLTEPWILIAEKINREPITLAEIERLGTPSKTVFKSLKSKVGNWFLPLTNTRA